MAHAHDLVIRNGLIADGSGAELRIADVAVGGGRSTAELKAAMGEAAVDLLILDLMLPGADGLRSCQELRRTSAIAAPG